MKGKHLKVILLLFTVCAIVISCSYDDDITSAYTPELIPRSVFEKTTKLSEPVDIEKSGKIYTKDNFIFINEVNKGFHVFDNSDPSAPKNIMFLEVLGATDMAIKKDVIFINNAVDLIAVTINPETKALEITKRIRNTFPQKLSPDGFMHDATDGGIVINWTKK